jgi:S-DNA-T family DNA segregation ATPase FtsK/SpoIIIE
MPLAAAKPAPSRAPSNWDLPDVQRLLQKPKHNRVDRDFLAAVAVDLENRLRHFRRAATVQPAEKQGALVSRYEITLAAGQEIAPIQAREEDLEAAYKGLRFASLSGTGKLGIEIPLPEPQRRPIMLREVLDSPAWTSSNAVFPIAIGVTSSNEPVVVDLASAKTPHMLVAGTTGSGKSVGVNAMLTSLLVRYSPSELKLLIFDPKIVEFVIFHGLPHLLKPVITEMEEAIEQLQWACKEMDERYVTMARVRAKNLESYNDSVCEAQRLPRIVIVIDEFADLMLVRVKNPNKPTELLNLKNSNELVTGLVMRLAQKARAAGIHVILATQRPSVDVVSGPVKANFGVRIAYKVLQREDSKTIVGTGGAELLLGNGDALCSIPSLSTDLVRVHGSFVSEEEVAAVVASWLSQATGEEQPLAVRSVMASSEPAGAAVGGDADVEPQSKPGPRADNGGRLQSDDLLVGAVPDPYEKAVRYAEAKGNISVRQIAEDAVGCGWGPAKKIFRRMLESGVIKPGGPNNTHVYIGPS